MAKLKRPRGRPRKHPVQVTSTPVEQEHPLRVLARSEPDERRRRFMLALAHVLPHLSPDEMDRIEPILRDAFGRVAFRHLMTGLV